MSGLVLKHPEPVTGGDNGHDVLFDIPPQSAPVMSPSMLADLNELKGQLCHRLSGPVTVTCHPHRIGHRGSAALRFQGEQGRIDVLITVSGRAQFPRAEDYLAPRWYIDVTDMVDALYLVLWLGEMTREPGVSPSPEAGVRTVDPDV